MFGVPPDAVHQEVFGAGNSTESGRAKEAKVPHPPAGSQGRELSCPSLAVVWWCKCDNRFKSLLEFAEACDVPVKWSCRTGVCHMCECGILDGELRYAPEPLDQPAAGNALICCSTPESQVNLDYMTRQREAIKRKETA